MYNRFTEYKEMFPNKVVKTNTNKDRITEEDILVFLLETEYTNIKENELARLCSLCGYSQSEFETLQEWFAEGKQKGTNISCH